MLVGLRTSLDIVQPGESPEASSLDKRAGYFPLIDPLRGFAAFSVLLYHLVASIDLPIPTSWPWAWFRVGFLGVDVFFAISGAVIVIALNDLQCSALTSRWRAVFASRRVCRVVPLYVVTSVLFVGLVAPGVLDRPDLGWQMATHVLMVHNLFVETAVTVNGPSWSLGVEMQFYALILLLGPQLLRANAWLATAGMFLLAAIWRYAAAVHFATEPGLIQHFALQLPGVIDTFAAGMLAARWRLKFGPPSPARGVQLAVVAVLCWCAALGLMHTRIADYWQHPLGVVGSHFLVSIACGFTVAAALCLDLRATASGARGLSLLMRRAGDLSYGLYLWHMGVLIAVTATAPELDVFVASALIVAITLILSWLGWRFVERPAQNWARRRIDAAFVESGTSQRSPNG